MHIMLRIISLNVRYLLIYLVNYYDREDTRYPFVTLYLFQVYIYIYIFIYIYMLPAYIFRKYVTVSLRNQLVPGIPNPFRESKESQKFIEIPRNL